MTTQPTPAQITRRSPTAITAIVGAIAAVLHAFGIDLPVGSDDISTAILVSLELGGFGTAFVRRWLHARRNRT